MLEFASDPERYVSAAEIAEKYGVSSHHLARCLPNSRASGIVESVRGAGGGYRFAGNARRLTLMDIIDMFEEIAPQAPERNTPRRQSMRRSAPCSPRSTRTPRRPSAPSRSRPCCSSSARQRAAAAAVSNAHRQVTGRAGSVVAGEALLEARASGGVGVAVALEFARQTGQRERVGARRCECLHDPVEPGVDRRLLAPEAQRPSGAAAATPLPGAARAPA